MKHIKKCSNGHYTLKDICPNCKEKTIPPQPPKFSPEDKFGNYRRKAKENFYKQKGYT